MPRLPAQATQLHGIHDVANGLEIPNRGLKTCINCLVPLCLYVEEYGGGGGGGGGLVGVFFCDEHLTLAFFE